VQLYFTHPVSLYGVEKYNVTFTASKIGDDVAIGKSGTVARNDKFGCN
jgi:hypothetical protein